MTILFLFLMWTVDQQAVCPTTTQTQLLGGFVLPSHRVNCWENINLCSQNLYPSQLGFESDNHSWANSVETSWSYQLSSAHRVWNQFLSRKLDWGYDWTKSFFTLSQSTNSKARSKQNLMWSSPPNIRHSCCSWEGWFTKQPLHSESIAWSRKQRTWRAVVLTSCSWASMVDWVVCYATSTYILWSSLPLM